MEREKVMSEAQRRADRILEEATNQAKNLSQRNRFYVRRKLRLKNYWNNPEKYPMKLNRALDFMPMMSSTNGIKFGKSTLYHKKGREELQTQQQQQLQQQRTGT